MINLKTKDWEIKNIETILLDKDGTFIDLHYFWGKMTELRAIEVIKRFNLTNDYFSKLCDFLGYNTNTGKMNPNGITALYSRSKIIEIFKNNLKDLGVDTTENYLAEIFDFVSEIFYKNINNYTKPINSAIEFIKKLNAKGIKLGIVTSDSIESTKLTLKNLNLEEFFKVSIGRECSKETKESGALSKIAIEKLNANPKTTIMIGDAPMDYLSAINSGIEKTILVSTGQIPKKELEKTSPYVVDDLLEIEII